MTPLYLGIIGSGPWAQKYVETIRMILCDRIKIMGYCRRLNEDAPGFEGILRWSTPEKLLEQRPDGVIIATDPRRHLDLASLAQEYRIPSLVEKPVSCTPLGNASKAISSFLEKHRDTNVPVKVGYIQLHTPGYEGLKNLCQERRIVKITSTGGNFGPFRTFSSLYDYGSHDVSLIANLIKDTHTFNIEYSIYSPKAIGEIFITKLEVVRPSGKVEIHVYCGNGFARKSRSLSISLDDGERITYDDTIKTLFSENTGKKYPISQKSPLEISISDFREKILLFKEGFLARSTALADLRFARRVTNVLDDVAIKSGISTGTETFMEATA